MNDKPFSPSCERNREPILGVLHEHLAAGDRVLEIGSGTGQHAVYFAQALPRIIWQPSDQAEYLPGIRAWMEYAQLPNTPEPLPLNVNDQWPSDRFDAVFSANTLHIMSWPEVCRLFQKLPSVLMPTARLIIYGPFNYGGQFTSTSNAQFQQWLQGRAPHMGIRDFEAVNQLAAQAGLRLEKDHAMPANNRCIVWRAEAMQANAEALAPKSAPS